MSKIESEMNSDLQLVTPFPPEHYPLLCAWLQQFPEQNFDDAGPRTLEALTEDMAERIAAGQTVYEIVQSGQPVGVIAISAVKHVHSQAKFCGICFDKSVHGQGVALEAVRMVLRKTFSAGAQSALAAYFSDNIAVRKMFKKIGREANGAPIAHDIGSFRNLATRNGQFVNMTMVVIDAVAFRKNDRPGVYQASTDGGPDLPSAA